MVILLMSHSGVCQLHELKVSTSAGVPQKNLFVQSPLPNSKFDYMGIQTISQYGTTLGYGYNLLAKYNVHLEVGLSYNQINYYQPIIEQSGIDLDHIYFNAKRIDFSLGVLKRFKVPNSQFNIDMKLNFVRRQFLSKTNSYSSGFVSNNEDWIEYSYELVTYTGGFYEQNNKGLEAGYYRPINTEAYLGTLYEFKNLAFMFGVTYSRNYFVFNDFNFDVNYYTNGSTTPTGTYSYNGFLDGTKFVTRDHFFTMSMGVSKFF